MHVYSSNYGENRENWKGFIIFPKFFMDFCLLCECLYRSKIKRISPTIFTDFHGGRSGFPFAAAMNTRILRNFCLATEPLNGFWTQLAFENFGQNYHATEDLEQFSYFVRFLHKGLLLSCSLDLNYASTVMNDIESRLKT